MNEYMHISVIANEPFINSPLTDIWKDERVREKRVKRSEEGEDLAQ